MAKKSIVVRDQKRQRMILQYAAKRAELKELGDLEGLDVLQNPILAQITSEAHATIPVAGIVNNVNWLLGQDGIFGIKTGNSDQAGGVYLFAAHDQLSASHSLTIVGALEGLPTLQIALNDAVPLLNSVKANFTDSTVVQAGQVVGYYDTPWGSTASAIANNALTTIVWDGQTPQPMLTLKPLRTPQFSGATVGTISLGLDSSGVSTPVTLSSNLSKPPLYWHIFRHKL
jgi:D-alanyl-D-alanine carboxypeptidase (penicillin-binding protein 5/6)